MTDDGVTSFGELLREHRVGCDLTQEALAERAGMSDRSIRALERGQNRPQRETARRLADALGLGGEDLERFLAAAGPAPRRRGAAPREPVSISQIPIPPTALLGREREVTEIGTLLARREAGVLTLTGPAGVGKTRLALEVARRAGGDFAGGAVFVPLASLSDPALVLTAVARELELTEGSGEPLARLTAFLQGKRVLLVLDNFEHLLDAAADVATLQAACPDLQLLVTSRAPLRLQAEQIFPVQPLEVPRGYGSGQLGPAALEALEGVPSVRLFAARARAVKPDFALTPANGWAVAEICGHLDGLPLAIELAAARAAILPPQALLVQLAHPLRLLTSGARDLPERQRTLRKAIAWSYDLLQREEQVLFRRMGVFAGGCDLEAAEKICLEGLSIDVLDGISALIEANLLVPLDGEEPRFGMLETIREFAVEQLASAGDGDEVRARHAAFYLVVAERASEAMMGPNHIAESRRVDRDLDNIRAALRWSRDSGNVLMLSRLATALVYHWIGRGGQSEGRTWLQEALARIPAEERSRERAAALAASGALANLLSDFEGARRELEESAAIWRELGGGPGLSQALAHLGIAYGNLGDGERSQAACEESLAVARAGGDLLHIGLGLHGKGVGLAWGAHDFDAARALYEESLAIFRAMEGSVGEAMVLNSLGDLARLQGDFAAARAHCERGLELALAIASKWHQAMLAHNLGHTWHGLGDERKAREHFRESLVLYRNMGDARGVAECVAGLACLEAEACPERAVRWFSAARAGVAAIGTELSLSNQPQYEAALEVMRAGLGEREFERLLGGEAVSLQVAVEEVLDAEWIYNGP